MNSLVHSAYAKGDRCGRDDHEPAAEHPWVGADVLGVLMNIGKIDSPIRRLNIEDGVKLRLATLVGVNPIRQLEQ